MRKGCSGTAAIGGAPGAAGGRAVAAFSLVFEGGEAQAPSNAEAHAIEKVRRERRGEGVLDDFNDGSGSDDVRCVPSAQIADGNAGRQLRCAGDAARAHHKANGAAYASGRAGGERGRATCGRRRPARQL